jgi:hypothetical protein
MDSLIEEINNIITQDEIINNDLDYLSDCYVNNITEFELPSQIFSQIEITMSYETIRNKFISKILEINETIYIDQNNIDSYLFYYKFN